MALTLDKIKAKELRKESSNKDKSKRDSKKSNVNMSIEDYLPT